MRNKITVEYDRLIEMDDRSLELVVGHPIPHRHLAKEDSVITHLISRYGYEETVQAITCDGVMA